MVTQFNFPTKNPTPCKKNQAEDIPADVKEPAVGQELRLQAPRKGSRVIESLGFRVVRV